MRHSVKALLLASFLFATPARAEPSAGDLATARAALVEGLAAREKGDIEGALGRLTTAFDLVPTPVTGYELGKTHMMLGHVLTARELFLRVGRLPQQVEESTRSTTARDESSKLAQSLEARIPTLKIKLTLPEGATATVRVDDEVVRDLGSPRAVDPGKHEVIAKAGDGPEQKVTIEIKESESRDVDLAPQWIVPKPPEPPKSSQTIVVRQTNPIAFVGFGLSSAALILTGFGAFMSAEAAGRARDKCGDDFCPQHVIDDERQTRNGWLAVTAVAGAATVAFLVLGIVSVNAPVKAQVTARGAFFEGRF